MRYYVNNKKLDFILNQLADDYQNYLIENLLNNYNAYNVDNIPLIDFVKLDAEIKDSYNINKKIRKIKLLFRIISLLVMSGLTCGIILFFKFNKIDNLDNETRIALICILIGCVFYVFSLTLLSMKLKPMGRNGLYVTICDKAINDENKYIIFYTWDKIESLLIQLSTRKKFMPISELIEEMASSNVLSEEEIESVKKLRLIRNLVAHNSDKYNIKEYTYDEITDIVEKNQKIIKKLDKLIS